MEEREQALRAKSWSKDRACQELQVRLRDLQAEVKVAYEATAKAQDEADRNAQELKKICDENVEYYKKDAEKWKARWETEKVKNK
jgi:seryl-tRNA synthetase